MAQAIGVVVAGAVATGLRRRFEQFGLAVGLDELEGRTVHFDAPFAAPGGEPLALLTVLVADESAGRRLAEALVSAGHELVLIDASTDRELGRLDGSAGAGHTLRAIRAARSLP